MAKTQKPAEQSKVHEPELVGGPEPTALAIQRKASTALTKDEDVPDFMKGDMEDETGKGEIGMDDIRLPRLAIAQGLSYQMTPGHALYMEDLKPFEFFNDLTTEIYGKGPLYFIPVKRSVARVQFRPRSEGGGVIDANVPANDPRNEWGPTDPKTGKGTPPLATKFVEFVVILVHQDKAPERIVISIKTTNKEQRRAAADLTTFVNGTRGPMFGFLYTVTSGIGKNDKGSYGVYQFKQAGRLQVEGLYLMAKEFAHSLEGKTIIVNRGQEDEDAEVDDSMASNPEGGAPAM